MRDARHIALTVVMLLIAALVVGGIGFGVYRYGYNRGAKSVKPLPADTVVVNHTDTLEVTLPPDTVTQTFYKTVRVPSDAVEPDAVVDSFSVTLPYERHFASLDSVIDLWYSGYDAKIDSAVVYKRYTTQIIRQPYEVEVWKMPRLTADLGVTAFYSEKSINPFLLGKVAYNAPKTTFAAYGAIDHNGRWAAGVGVSYRFNLIK